MAIKPTDIVNWEGEGTRLEKLIDAKLKSDWKGEGSVRFDLPHHLPERIVKQLIKVYTDSGWSVSHNKGDCQKDGPWNYLEFREAR